MTDSLVPTQADREAAARWAKSNSRHAQAANIRRGSCDTAPLVQAFARHAAHARLEAIEEAATVADQYCQRMARLVGESAGDDGAAADAAFHANRIATAIRNLSTRGERK